jgi:MOSC domain-containing protein YiiM
MAALVAVCAVTELRPKRDGGYTAIDKRPVPGPVRIEPLGVAGDRQLSRGHGGFDQALYAYAREEARRWSDELGRDIPPGSFGENLAVQGIPVTDAVVGERWRIGAEVIAEVTQPRTPCATFQGWMDEPQWVRRFTAQGDVGAYLRVIRPGTVRAGDPIEVIHKPEHGVTVRQVFTAADQQTRTLQRLLDEAEYLSKDALAKVRTALSAKIPGLDGLDGNDTAE